MDKSGNQQKPNLNQTRTQERQRDTFRQRGRDALPFLPQKENSLERSTTERDQRTTL